jgi:hypothetical protein
MNHVGRSSCTVEVFLNIDIEDWLKVAETAILHNTEYGDESIENEMVHFARLIVLRDQNAKERVEYITEEFDNLDLAYESKFRENGGEKFSVNKLLPVQQAKKDRILSELGRAEGRSDGSRVFKGGAILCISGGTGTWSGL